MQGDRYSLSAQKFELNEYAKSQNWKVVGEFKDIDSGGKLDKKGLESLLDNVEEGKIDVVLVVDQNRLSRLDTIAWEYLKSTLRENDVKIAEPGNIVDLNNEDHEFISDIKNLIARREKKGIVRTMMRGKRQLLREGKGWGKPPLGYYYDKTDKTYKIDKNWSWVIPFIDDLYLNKQMGLTAISRELNKISRTPTGRIWNETLVYRRLISKAFHGVMEKTFATGETISVEGIYPPLRSKETYEEIQRERERRRNYYKVSSKGGKIRHMHPLRRVYFSCGLCGRKIYLQQSKTSKNGNTYFYLKHGRKMRLKDQSRCLISINTIRLEKNLYKAIKDILTDEEKAKNYVNLLDINEDDLKKFETTKKQHDTIILKAEQKLNRLIDLYLDGEFSKDILNTRKKEIENEISFHKKKSSELKSKIDTLRKKALDYNRLVNFFEIARNLETDLTTLEQAKMIGELFPTGILYNEKLILNAEFEEGFPVEIIIPIDPDPFIHLKKNRRKTNS